MTEYHTAVIGAGSGGITAAIGLSGFGKEVALIEKADVGGDCTNVGCVPSKTLIYLAKHMEEQGLTPAQVLEKVRTRRNELRDEETHWIKDVDKVTLYEAEAKFTDAHTLALSSGESIKAQNIIIASGSRAIRIPVEGLPEDKYLTNENLFDLEDMPEHLAIVGAGVIGTEMAFAFSTLGSKVTLIDLAPRILSVLEPEVSTLMSEVLAEKGVTVHTGTKGKHYDPKDNTFYLDHGGEEIALKKVDKVLVAIGRTPNLDLDLEKAGVEYGKRGITTSAGHRTNIQNIYAIGDVDPASAFTHSANAQGRRVVQKIALPYVPLGKEAIYPSATFSTPEIGQVGPTLAKLKETYCADLIVSVRHDLKDTDRAYTQYLERGFVMIHAMRLTGRVLSATIVAPNASEMIPLLTQAVNKGGRLYGLASLVFPYPVLSEAIKKASDKFVFDTLPNLQREAKVYAAQRWRRPKVQE